MASGPAASDTCATEAALNDVIDLVDVAQVFIVSCHWRACCSSIRKLHLRQAGEPTAMVRLTASSTFSPAQSMAEYRMELGKRFAAANATPAGTDG